MKNPPIQGQHIIPDVYLKQFSFTTKGNHQKIKVLRKGQKGIQEEFVKGFNKVDNIFDIESDDPRIERVFEEYHGLFETHYPKILEKLIQNSCLPDEEYSLLIQFTANMISRSTNLRENVLNILGTDAKSNFVKDVIAHGFQTQEELDSIEKSELFINLNSLSADKSINRILMLFNEYLFARLEYFKVVFFEAPTGKCWFTTNNPVLLENNLGNFNFLVPESDIYFPLTPKYLAYFHCENSKTKTNILRAFQENTVNIFPENLFDELTKKIITNTTDFVVCPIES